LGRSSKKETPTNGGLRYDEGKTRLDLIPAEWIEGLGQVLTMGAAKYEPRNWEQGMPYSKVYGPLLRHANKFQGGESHDPESGLHHLLHVAWNALALYTYEQRGIGEDDRSG
jgi:hypothetical protein